MLRKILGLAARFALYFVVFSVLSVLVFKFVPVFVTPLIISRKIEASRNGKDSEIHKKWKSYDQISKEMALAVVASEDQNFPKHWGFDLDEIYDAVTEKKKRMRGASTISQQVAKNVFLWNGRSYIRKALEAWFTLLIELIWGKERILEVYLNVAEMGPMIFGAEAAARQYYNKPASGLNRQEAARIAVVLPNPNKFSVRNPSNYIVRRTNQIARQMRYLGGQSYLEGL